MRKLFLLILCFITLRSEAQVNNPNSGLTIFILGNYVSSATIELSPFSQDLIERNQTAETSGGYGYGIALKKRFFRDDLSIGISTEFIKITDDQLTGSLFVNDTTIQRFRIVEELTMTPIELSILFDIPKFTKGLNIYLGGGAGVYFGDRVRTIRGVESETISKKAGINFHILSGAEYYLSDNLAAVFEMKFRQAGYTVKSNLNVLQGTTANPSGELNSRIFLDGLKLSLGFSVHI